MIRGAALILDMTVIVIHVHELRAAPVLRVESQYSSNRLDGGGRGRESRGQASTLSEWYRLPLVIRGLPVSNLSTAVHKVQSLLSLAT